MRPRVQKVVPCLLRSRAEGLELLVFTHPNGTVQIPKGTLGEGESPRLAAVRELREESGIDGATVESEVDVLARIVPRGPSGAGPAEEQSWHVFTLRIDSETSDSWSHVATGSPEEEGLVFRCEWVLLSTSHERLDPLYHPVVDALRLAARLRSGA